MMQLLLLVCHPGMGGEVDEVGEAVGHVKADCWASGGGSEGNMRTEGQGDCS